MPSVMSINVQAYGAPARLTLRDYQIAGTAVTPQAPHAPPAKTLDQFTPSDHTAVLPVPLVPVADAQAPAAEAEPTVPVATVETETWSRRALLGAIAAIAAIVLLLGISAARDGIEVPTPSTDSTQPVSVETTTTTAAPTTTSPPTTEKPAPAHEDKGKGKKAGEASAPAEFRR